MLTTYDLNSKSHRLDLIVIVAFFVLLASCSKDDTIVRDYKLYDLDGSNQVIMGGSAMVSVSDVTAYRYEEDLIYFETGILDSPISVGNNVNRCRYGFINTARNVVVVADMGSDLQRLIMKKLIANRRGALTRSCISKN
jgi:hypothetical protein